ncbi:Uma2 family endonuclease [bacterium]|nr:Uma2 family endonuclease [bacterium]
MNPIIDELDIGQSANLTDIAMCINHYRLSTPGMHVCIHVPVQINKRTRLTPGLIAQIGSGKFNQCKPVKYDYFSGPPNFIFDVFRDEQMTAYESRKEVFEQNGVLEYVVWFNSSELPIWNRLINGKYQEVKKGEDGLIRSSALPGLWIPIDAWAKRDIWSILAKISQGITRRGHRDFMATIWKG